MSDTIKGIGGEWVKVKDGRWVYITENQARERRKWKGTYTMSKAEKDKLFIQTGVQFADHAEYKAWCKVNDFRDLERGEPQDIWRREADERAEAGLPPEDSYRDRALRANREKRLAILEQARRMGVE